MSNITNTRLRVGHEIVQPLRTLETDIDTAIATAGRMMTALADGRKEAKVAACMGADAFEHLHSTVSALFNGRGAVLQMHRSLAEVRDELRLPIRAFGDESPKVEAPSGRAEAPLQAVA